MDGVMVLFLLIGLSGGLLLGLLVGWLVGRREGEKKALTDQPALATEEAPAEQEREAASPPPSAGQEATPPSLGLLLRRRAGVLEVVLDGVAYRQYATMPSDSRNRLLGYLRLVRTWMEGKPTQEMVIAASPQQTTAVVPPPSSQKQASGEVPLRRMIEQIDEIVRQLQAETDLSEPVRVVGGLQGGVNILVGLKRYEHIDEVPNEAVRALVRRAVQIWESQQ